MCPTEDASESADIAFFGQDGEECERFIRAVHKAAYASGKIRDNAWMADFAMPCFAGRALRYYQTLENEITTDWSLLRQHLLENYPSNAEDKEYNSQHDGVSCPSAPAFIPVALPVPQKGRIKVLGEDCAEYGYVGDGQNVYHAGIGAGAPETEAIIFCYLPLKDDLFEIEIQRSDSKPQLLGAHWHAPNPSTSVGSIDFAVLAAFNYEGLRRSSKTGWGGPGYTQIWKVGPDNTLHPYFVGNDTVGHKQLQFFVHEPGGHQRRAVDVAADAGAFMVKHGPGGWKLVELLFEPCA